MVKNQTSAVLGPNVSLLASCMLIMWHDGLESNLSHCVSIILESTAGCLLEHIRQVGDTRLGGRH